MKFKQVLEQVDADARNLKPHVALLTIVAAVLFAVGWLIGMVFRGVWLVIGWAWYAGVHGFKTARGKAGT